MHHGLSDLWGAQVGYSENGGHHAAADLVSRLSVCPGTGLCLCKGQRTTGNAV
jgi:hypothetical protein